MEELDKRLDHLARILVEQVLSQFSNDVAEGVFARAIIQLIRTRLKEKE